MAQDLHKLLSISAFYRTPLGIGARDLLRDHLAKYWPQLTTERIAAVGSDALLSEPPSLCARMTGPDETPFSCLVDARNKPLPDASVDRMVVLHPASGEIGALVRELWRVLTGEGRVLLVVPRKGSAWAENPKTPFSDDPAFSAAYLRKAFVEKGFVVESVSHALFASPDMIEQHGALAKHLELLSFFGFFGGVLVVSACKRVCAGARVQEGQRKRAAALTESLALPVSGRTTVGFSERAVVVERPTGSLSSRG